MTGNSDKECPELMKLIEVMRKLRDPEEGCPWDLEQNHSTLKPYLIEEAYEVIDAIDNHDMGALKNELGDLLLHIVFHAQMGKEKGEFDIEDVASAITKKIIRRHPHVFGDVKADTPKKVKQNWEALKLEQENRTLFSGVPRNLPALLKAFRVQEKSADVGFEWKDISGVEEKIAEEMAEFHAARAADDKKKMEEEFGDLLFALVNLARWLDINAELALSRTVDKFIRRFGYIEKRLAENGSTPYQSSLEEMDGFWEESKGKV